MNATCACTRSEHRPEFDAEAAYRRLAKKYDLLAQCMASYLEEENKGGGERSEWDNSMAAMLERIVGGRVVTPGAFPECCLIGQTLPNGTKTWFCTGVLVHKRIVLTAAHCHAPPRISARAVALRADSMNNLGQAEIVSVRRAIVNPLFATTGSSDIAVLILRRDATVSPVEMATAAETSSATRTTLVGFGNSDTLSSRGFGIKREVTVPITNIRRTPSDNFDAAEDELGFESDVEFTAGGNGFDSCNGDSGGPAYITVNGVRKVAGLTSAGFARSSTPCGEGGIYTRVDSQLAFIREAALSAGIHL